MRAGVTRRTDGREIMTTIPATSRMGAPPPSGLTAPRPTTAARRRPGVVGRLFDFHRSLPTWLEIVLGIAAWVAFIALWYAIVYLELANPALVPTPHETVATWWELVTERGFASDIAMSVKRISLSFAVACGVAIPLGVLMGAFTPVEAFFNPLVAPARYLPAPSFVPLLLMWFGAGDFQKLVLLWLGVVWFLVTLIMDHTKTARLDLIETSKTLGGGRREVLFTVVVPQVMPGIVTAMRQMLAVSWTYLVIAEIVAATDGIGAMMMRAKRFVRTEEIAAGILTIGVLGILADLTFRIAHRLLFPYLYKRRR